MTTTIATCNMACWMAREESCRCSCGGAGHGVMLAGEGQPRRTRLIKGVRYVIAGVGEDPTQAWYRAEREAILDKFGVTYSSSGSRYLPERFFVSSLASESQARTWPEAAPIITERTYTAGDGSIRALTTSRRPTIHWIRADAAPMFDEWEKSHG